MNSTLKPNKSDEGVALFLVAVFLVPIFAMVIVTIVSVVADVPIAQFTRDPAALMHAHPATGFLSNLGVLIWCAAASICIFSGTVQFRRYGRCQETYFFLSAGAMTMLLMLDDFFLLHEEIFPRYLNIPEQITYSVYAALLFTGLYIFRRTITQTKFTILILAFFLLGSSVGVDIIQDHVEKIAGEWRILIEDGFKLLGITAWFAYFYRSAADTLCPELVD